MEKLSKINYNGVEFVIEDAGALRKLEALLALYDKFNEPYIAGDICHLPELIKSLEHILEFPAKDVNEWILRPKLDYPYFVMISNNPSLCLYTRTGNMIHLNMVFLSEYLPTEPYVDWDADEDDIITIYYGDK